MPRPPPLRPENGGRLVPASSWPPPVRTPDERIEDLEEKVAAQRVQLDDQAELIRRLREELDSLELRTREVERGF